MAMEGQGKGVRKGSGVRVAVEKKKTLHTSLTREVTDSFQLTSRTL